MELMREGFEIGGFTIRNVKGFRKELQILSAFAQKKSTIPILQYVKITANALTQEIDIVGTNLDDALFVNLGASVSGSVGFCVELEALKQVVKSDAKEIRFSIMKTGESADNSYKLLRADLCIDEKTNISMEARDIYHFPEIEVKTEKLKRKIEADVLQDLIRKTVYAVTTENSRFTLQGICFEFGKKGLRLVATDGHRLSVADTKDFEKKQMQAQAIISVLVCKFLQSKCYGKVGIFGDDKSSVLQFVFDRYTVLTRKLTGRFPNYEMVVPKDTVFHFEIKRAETLRCVKDAIACANETTKSISLQPYKQNLVIQSGDAEKAFQTLATCSYTDIDACAVKFDGRYLSEALSACDARISAVSYKDSKSQVMIQAESNISNYTAVIMPLSWGKDTPDKMFIVKGDLPQGDWFVENEKPKKDAPKFSANRKREAVESINTILSAMNDAVDANELPERFTLLFKKAVSVMQKELEVLS